MALFIRTCKSDFTSYNGFVWSKNVGDTVVAPDWKDNAECGNGLHGLLNGQQDSDLLSKEADAVWMVVEADLEKAIDLQGKYKFES